MPKQSPATRRRIRVVAAEIVDGRGNYLITQRNPYAVMPLLWEFPGGKIESGETDEEALVREISEELGIAIEVGDRSVSTVRDYDDYELEFSSFHATIASGEPQRIDVWDFRWVRPAELDRYRFPPADKASIDRLLGLAGRETH